MPKKKIKKIRKKSSLSPYKKYILLTKKNKYIVLGVILLILALLIFLFTQIKIADDQQIQSMDKEPVPTEMIDESPAPTTTSNSIKYVNPTATSTPTDTLAPQNNPNINNFSPTSGHSGQQITIYGNNFGPETGGVNFCTSSGCSYGAPIDSWSDTEIKAKVPGIIAATGSYDFYVHTKSGKDSNKKTFTVSDAQPRINDITPGQAKTGDEITIKGSNFQQNGTVTFRKNSDIVATGSVISWDDTEIKITIPSSLTNGEEYNIQVTNGGGANSSVKFYTLGN